MKSEEIVSFVKRAVNELRRAVVRGPISGTEEDRLRHEQQSDMLLRWEFIDLCLDRCATHLDMQEYYTGKLSEANRTVMKLEGRVRELEKLLKDVRG